jgi:ABC-type Fe3+ transport system permease subunit
MERKTVGRALIAALLLFQCAFAQSDLSDASTLQWNQSVMWDETPEQKMEFTSRATGSLTEGSLASGVTVLIVLVAAASALKMKSLGKTISKFRGRLS